MLKRSKKILAMLLSVMFVISLIPASSVAAAEAGEVIYTSFDSAFTQIRSQYASYVSFVSEATSAKTFGGRDDVSAYFEVSGIADDVNMAHTCGKAFVNGDTTGDFTYEFSFYQQGDAQAHVNVLYDDYSGDKYALINCNKDGSLWYNTGSINGSCAMVDSGMKLEIGKWHRIVLRYEMSRQRFHIYADGVRITESSVLVGAAAAAKLWIGVAPTSGNGIVAYEDFESYYGAYTPDSDDEFNVTDSATLVVDEANSVIVYDSFDYNTPAALAQGVIAQTGAKYAKVFADSTLTTEAVALDDDCVCVFTSPSGAKYAYYDIQAMENKNSTTMAGIVSSQARVQVLEDKIAVFSQPLDKDYYLGSDYVMSALSASEGYTLKYLNANKEEATVAHVADGYIVASHTNGRTMVFPVVTKGTAIAGEYPAAANIYNSHISLNGSSYEGLGGKGADDKIAVYTAGAAPGTIVKKTTSPVFSGLNSGAPYTFETSFYFDGKAGISATYNWEEDAYRLMYTDENGDIWYNVNGTLTKGENLEAGKWYRLAITWDSPRNRHHIYLNGKLLTHNSKYVGANETTRFRIGIASESYDGKVAFDDFEAYYGYYYADELDIPVIASTDSLIFDTDAKKLTYDEFEYPTADALAQAVKENAGSTYAAVIDDTLVFTSPNGKGYAYYAIEKMGSSTSTVLAGITSSSPYVQILADSVAVLGHRYDAEYFVSSETLLSALSAKDGYTLSYVNDNYEAASAINAVNGYIKAENANGRIIYFPVVTKGKSLSEEFATVANGVFAGADIRNTHITHTAGVGGIGGKAQDDTSYVFTAGAAPAQIKEQISSIMYSALPSSAPYTAQMDVYVGKNAGFAINYRYQETNYSIVRIAGDGTVLYNYNGNLVALEDKIDTDKWHSVAVTYDTPRARYHLYIDGEKITDYTGAYNQTQAAYLLVGITHDSANDIVAVDNFKAYSGYYYLYEGFAISSDGANVNANVDVLLAGEYVLGIAAYCNGELMAVDYVKITPDNLGEASVAYNSNYTYKAFLWSAATLQPACPPLYLK